MTKKKAGKRGAKPAKGWAWVIQDRRGDWVLCRWAEPTKDVLMRQGRPSPEAKPVRVRLTLEDTP